jgi:hypothetical protein
MTISFASFVISALSPMKAGAQPAGEVPVGAGVDVDHEHGVLHPYTPAGVMLGRTLSLLSAPSLSSWHWFYPLHLIQLAPFRQFVWQPLSHFFWERRKRDDSHKAHIFCLMLLTVMFVTTYIINMVFCEIYFDYINNIMYFILIKHHFLGPVIIFF